jgi:hypothetical protein
VTILAGVDAGLKMLVPFFGSVAAKETPDEKASIMIWHIALNAEIVVSCINIVSKLSARSGGCSKPTLPTLCVKSYPQFVLNVLRER